MSDTTGVAAGPGEPPPGSSGARPAAGAPAEAELRTFLIADIRGYTAYTEEHGTDAAADLAARFAGIVREVVASHDGFLLELRGDEALAVFVLARRALRAALELQGRFGELPRGAGIGLDAGEAIPVEGGYRGSALNLAARLCSQAGPGETLASEAVIHLAARVDGVGYTDPRTYHLKGIDEPVRAVHVVPEALGSRSPIRYAGGGRADRRLLTAGVAALAVVGIVAVAVVALRPGGVAGPTPPPSGEAASPAAGPPSASPDGSFPNPAEAALLAELAGVPDLDPAACARDPESPFFYRGVMTAGVVCATDPASGAIELIVRRFDPATIGRHDLSTWIRVEVGNQGGQDALPEGDCAEGFPAIGTWEVGADVRGVVACGIDDATGDAVMAWADDYGGLLMSARNPRGDAAALYAFFERNARFIAP